MVRRRQAGGPSLESDTSNFFQRSVYTRDQISQILQFNAISNLNLGGKNSWKTLGTVIFLLHMASLKRYRNFYTPLSLN
jgi:hypothetical protein